MAKRDNNSITLVDQDGKNHTFEVLQFFDRTESYALMRPAKSKKNEATILGVKLGEDGLPASFRDLSEDEFELAVEALEGSCDCGDECDCDGACDEAECCGGAHHEEKKAAPKKAAKKPAAKKVAAAKKPAAKAKKAARKPARRVANS